MTSLQIREFHYPQDYSRTLQLWRSIGDGVRVGASDEPAEIEKKLTRDPDLFLIAEDGEDLIGTVIGGFDGRRGFVYHLAVATSRRRQGVGSALMAEVEARLRQRGCIRCYLLVFPENVAAQRHYENIGWNLLDDLVYAKDLN